MLFAIRRVAVLALLLLAGTAADAGFIQPAGLQPGDQFRLVFVSDTSTTATSSDVATYDAIVTHDAAAAGLGTIYGNAVTWQALVSTPTVSAISRLPGSTFPLYRVDGTLVADASAAPLWSSGGAWYVGINRTAGGTVKNANVWTGTQQNGQGATYYGAPAELGEDTLSSLGALYSVVGISNEENHLGIEIDLPYGFRLQDQSFALYGYSSVLTVPAGETTVAVPEPASMTLFAFGAAVLAGCALRRRKANR